MDALVFLAFLGLGQYAVLFAAASWLIAHALAAGLVPMLAGTPATFIGRVYGRAIFPILNVLAGANWGQATNAVNKAAADLGLRYYVWMLLGLTLPSLAAVGLLAACTGQVSPTAVSLLQLASGKNATVANLVQQGALFCRKQQPIESLLAPVIVVAANAAGVPVIVTNQTKAAVDSTCASLGAVAVSPPANPETVQVVPAVTTLPAVTTPAAS